LRVTERMGHFIDREEPASDKVHRAAFVLKYVVERRCPELGAIDKTLQGASRGCMPADLFEVGQVVPAKSNPQIQSERRSIATPFHAPALTASSDEAVSQPQQALTNPDVEAPVSENSPRPAGTDGTLSADVAAAQPALASEKDTLSPAPAPAMGPSMSSHPSHSAGLTSSFSAASATLKCASSVAPRRLSYSSTAGRHPTADFLLRSQFASPRTQDGNSGSSDAKRQRRD